MSGRPPADEALRVLLALEGGSDRAPEPLPAEADLVRRVRVVAQQFGEGLQAVEQLLAVAQGQMEKRATENRRQPLLAAALPHMVRVLQHARLSIEEGWDDLDTGFSIEDLLRAAAARGDPAGPAR